MIFTINMINEYPITFQSKHHSSAEYALRSIGERVKRPKYYTQNLGDTFFIFLLVLSLRRYHLAASTSYLRRIDCILY